MPEKRKQLRKVVSERPQGSVMESSKETTPTSSEIMTKSIKVQLRIEERSRDASPSEKTTTLSHFGSVPMHKSNAKQDAGILIPFQHGNLLILQLSGADFLQLFPNVGNRVCASSVHSESTLEWRIRRNTHSTSSE